MTRHIGKILRSSIQGQLFKGHHIMQMCFRTLNTQLKFVSTYNSAYYGSSANIPKYVRKVVATADEKHTEFEHVCHLANAMAHPEGLQNKNLPLADKKIEYLKEPSKFRTAKVAPSSQNLRPQGVQL